MKKILLFFLFLLFLLNFYIPPFLKKVYASSEFLTEANVVYDIGKDGKARVSQTITLTNLVSTVYASSYTLNFKGQEISNFKALEGSSKANTEIKKEKG